MLYIYMHLCVFVHLLLLHVEWEVLILRDLCSGPMSGRATIAAEKKDCHRAIGLRSRAAAHPRVRYCGSQ